MISHSGVIFQYSSTDVDWPVAPSPELLHAFEPVTQSVSISGKAISKQILNRSFTGLIIGGLVGLFILASPLLYIEARYRLSQTQAINPDEQVRAAVAEAVPTPSPTPHVIVSSYNVDLTPTPAPELPDEYGAQINDAYLQVLRPVDTDFSVIIPKIGVNSKIVPNVDPGNEAEYRDALTQGVAHSKGSYLPGQNGITYVFAHSTDYVWNIQRFNAVFFLLREMQENDQIYVVYENKVYPYQVTEVRIVDPGETYYLKPKQGEEGLILQTCWPPGTTDKRLLVFAKPGGSILAAN